jgi:hypothetical protein
MQPRRSSPRPGRWQSLPARLAQASKGDRDWDRMPDRWEPADGLSPRVNDAARDRDGLANLAEYRSGTDPRTSDSDREDADHDGVRSDSEHYADTEGHSDDS